MPRHKVRITQPFYISRTCTITYGNFLTFYHNAHYKTDAERDGKPNWGHDPKGTLIQSTDFVFWNTGWEQTYEHPVVYVSVERRGSVLRLAEQESGKEMSARPRPNGNTPAGPARKAAIFGAMTRRIWSCTAMGQESGQQALLGRPWQHDGYREV